MDLSKRFKRLSIHFQKNEYLEHAIGAVDCGWCRNFCRVRRANSAVQECQRRGSKTKVFNDDDDFGDIATSDELRQGSMRVEVV